MTQFLIRLFIRQPDHAQDPKVRAAYGNLACWVGMACNLLLCLGKLTVGTLFGSIAIMADSTAVETPVVTFKAQLGFAPSQIIPVKLAIMF